MRFRRLAKWYKKTGNLWLSGETTSKKLFRNARGEINGSFNPCFCNNLTSFVNE